MTEQLEVVEGRPLSEADVTELRTVAKSLCHLDDSILQSVWSKLTPEQFTFQDYVFSAECPERATFYALETGRVVTDEADAATEGIILPTSTTTPSTTTRPPTTPPAATRPTTTETGAEDPSTSAAP